MRDFCAAGWSPAWPLRRRLPPRPCPRVSLLRAALSWAMPLPPAPPAATCLPRLAGALGKRGGRPLILSEALWIHVVSVLSRRKVF